jgi:4a-hydroxytetrahydrobiopterin dehydratase
MMATRNELLARHCQERGRDAALSEEAIRRQLAELDGWGLRDGSVVRTYRFANYYETMAFVNALAWMTHREDHHPDLLVTYNRCEVRYNTHSAGGISDNDFICAAKCDAIHAQQFGA